MSSSAKAKKAKSEKSSAILLDIFCRNKIQQFMNRFLHAGDLFEAGKEFAFHKTIEITGDGNLDKLPEITKMALEQTGEEVIFIAIRSIDGKRCKNPRAIFKEGIQSISTIQKDKSGWGLFKTFLETLGYKVETDKHMRVTSIS